jgi:uncharacterized membrane protein YccC
MWKILRNVFWGSIQIAIVVWVMWVDKTESLHPHPGVAFLFGAAIALTVTVIPLAIIEEVKRRLRARRSLSVRRSRQRLLTPENGARKQLS